MPDAIHRKIRTYVDDPNFSPVVSITYLSVYFQNICKIL